MSARLISILAAFCGCIASFGAESFTGELLNVPFEIHGRLSSYNGTPSLRIWIVGSKRILGVPDSEGAEEDGLPKPLLEILQRSGGWPDGECYGDFTVEPLQPDKKGHMRFVRILSAKNLVVVRDGKILLRIKENES